MLSVRGRIIALATMLLLLSLSIAGTAWHALTKTSDQFQDSVRAGNYLGYLIVAIREFSGADRRIINYIQTGRRDDEQRYAKRRADTEGAFAKALDLVQDDPVRRQAMLNLQQDIHDFFAASESLIRERRSLGQRASALRDGLVALGATSSSGTALDSYVGALQQEAQATLLAVLDPSDAREQSFTKFMDAAGPATSATLWSQFSGTGPSINVGDTIRSQTVGAVPPKPGGVAATASNSAAAIDTNLLLISKKAEEVAKTLPAGNPAADGVLQILVVTAMALVGGLLLTGFTTHRVGGSLQTVALATTGLARGDHAVVIPNWTGTDELSGIARALGVLKQNADRRASVTTAMTLVAGGDHAVDIPELQSADEIGVIARAAQAFRRKSEASHDTAVTGSAISNMAGVVARAAGGDLAVRVPLEAAAGPLRELGDQINRLIESSSASLHELDGRVRDLVTETRAAAQKAADGSQAEADAAAEMAASLAEAERAIRRIGASLLSARQTAGSLADVGEQSLVAVDRLAVLVDAIVRASNNINEISQEIAAIASRTQFLCLNATIEASRSGDQGKGFGVVAQEVGKLAEKAHQNSRQLATLVEQGSVALADGKATSVLLSGMIRNVVGESQQTTQMIDSSAAAVDAQQASLGRIGSAISDWGAAVARRAAATKQITAGLDRIAPSAEAARPGITGIAHAASTDRA